ncbi:UPF0488 protein C8orf33 homolog [Aythya fuligula]|uniref:UPF0488 protein C8orf33 homolog n=1 Tax=Aythya fuligula TaxID=219594 RepID=A0A6J3DT19_AYTFU|nr:UPF0488 protein C8orf33 homolog [Aythya fuligula]XP_032053808.1 UPF0488 protein C8orf33 homolog [Aythya fuligula]XP_032053809.1 UPF0488 protein C8orf33 homolog [Aythya fuligula]XP_032053810.1 UPF0488 protein C8orf33 homolog [Aythya fuligula]XP_032053811.1 UPF0488 protein C8orf33 homolog [Aythya fuligula]XP_032053813.1 UPF0488 protein C8orf33 homolog [Aythya fuligula]XP_032053814.1 UPF0488 protein C8orf33 homolog [Aythya fuligula]XP_032053815.1 UPF0488 protein C8orf33 homolog [Aythya fulig
MEKAATKAGDVEAQQGNGQASDGVAYRKQSDQISEANPTWSMSPDNNFRFDFTLPEADPEATGALLEAVPGAGGAEQIQTSVRATEQENWSGALHSVDSEHESKFAFNFAIPDEADEDCPPEPVVPASQRTEGMADHEVLGGALPAESAEVLQVTALQKPELAQTAGSPPKEDKSHPTLKIPKPESAPGDKTVMEKSTSDGAAQKKKKKKKQKPSVSKKETEETEVIRKTKTEANGCQNKDASHQDETLQQSDDRLWKEVDWCAEQLELGLKTQKSTPKQAEEALRAIKTLRNDKAPLVKKRQVMRTLFGDYRKKMEEERCKQLKLMQAAAKSARIMEVEESIRNKNCQVVRKRSGVCRKSQDSSGSPSESNGTLNTGSFRFTASQEEFRFNFF